MGMMGLSTVTVIGTFTPSGYDPLKPYGGPVSRKHSVMEIGRTCALPFGIPAVANITSIRNAPMLFGVGMIDKIPDSEIIAQSVGKTFGVHGRPHHVLTFDKKHRIGRFGWKGKIATVHEFVGGAFRNELGITNPVAPNDVFPSYSDPTHPCPGDLGTLEDDGTMVDLVTTYVSSLPAPAPQLGAPGQDLFETVGCNNCHVEKLASPQGDVPLFSDLLLHDMGPTLNDNIQEADAKGTEWRTTPLWGLHMRTRFLHDGRAGSVMEAIVAHDGGEAGVVEKNFLALTADQQQQLVTFVSAL
jgi:CxxC motif-containing protein (DUF1111 family)